MALYEDAASPTGSQGHKAGAKEAGCVPLAWKDQKFLWLVCRGSGVSQRAMKRWKPMTITGDQERIALVAVLAAGAMLVFSASIWPGGMNRVAATVKAKLHGDDFRNVQVSVDSNGIATLSGSVALYEIKEDAGRAAEKVKGVNAVRDDIEVGGPNLSDAKIAKKLAPQLAYSREGYGNVFDAITMKVENGVVTLGGHAHDYPNRDAAVGIAATTPGVKDVIDAIQVDPVSEMDWGIRMRMARAIYRDPALNKYAIDPIRPIRISVQNGNVELYGTVDNEMDRTLAYTQAMEVPGVFSVKNYIQVADAGKEKQQE